MPKSCLSFWLASFAGAGILASPLPLNAQFLPTEVGTTVSGFQDDFDGSSLNPSWVVRGQNVFSVSGGALHVSTASGDPNHLLYELAGYNNSTQEILARIRVTSFGSGDPARAGLGAVVDTATSQGINLHFRDEPSAGQRHLEFLNDTLAWGTEFPTSWQNNTWYWLRLRHEPNAASQGGVNDVFGKIWLADGSQAEPAAWQMTYDYTPTRAARTGFAGVTAGSSGTASEFDVDYILLKAAGLPSVVVSPNTFFPSPVALTNQPANQTVTEGSGATFAVGASGSPAPTFQWYRDDNSIPGATSASYTLPTASVADSGARFHVVAQNVVSNITYTATSSHATLTVLPDNVRPTLAFAQAIGLTQVQVTFSERLLPLSATNRVNYQITNAAGTIDIPSLALDMAQSNVTLNVSPMTHGATYTLVVNNVRDASSSTNAILPNSTITFAAADYTPVAIGNPLPAGGAVSVPGGINLSGGGRDLGGIADQFQFSYLPRAGDFDVKVRLESLSLADAWSKAGLVAREDSSAGARFAAALATPSIAGAFFEARAAANAAATASGSAPINYPAMWLRLQRAGNQFTGYAGYDGQRWSLLGSANIPLPSNILLGFAAASHNTNQTTLAAFRDFSSAGVAATLDRPLPIEPLGQSSRRTSLIISEIMYNPLDRADHKNLEFVELFNAGATTEELGGWRLDGDADFTFPSGTVLRAGQFLVVATSPADVESAYGISGVLGPFSSTNSLPNTQGRIQLRHRTGAVFLDARYGTQSPWPAAADGAGHSLVLARPSYGEGNVEAWAASDSVGGSPGRGDPIPTDPLRHVVINEFLAHTDEPAFDFIELYNHSQLTLDISGCFLTDSRNTNKFVIPAGTVLGPRQFAVFDQNQLGFSLSASGENIYFRNAATNRVLDAVHFEAQANGVASGRFPDGAPSFSLLASPTPGTNNASLRVNSVVINELMFNPISGNSDDEYIELYNRGETTVNLGGWRLADGVSYTFPAGASIPPGGYLVIAHKAAHLIPRYPQLNTGNTLGDYDGTLANGGERIALAFPDPSFTTNNSVITTNFSYVVVDEVTYREGGRWGRWADGGGSSLELIDARADKRLAAHWADSDETAKAPWTIVDVRGVLDNGTSAPDQLQVLLHGAGECLIDDVQVVTMGGVNLVANSTFEGSTNGWTAEGTQEASGWEQSEGYLSARSYHVRASDRGDNQVNRIRTPLTSAQTAVTNSIRAKVRWLRGHPELLFRLRGNWLEAAVTMDLPTNLGTPGAPNSRRLANGAPAISDVTHFPPVPAANQPVTITARVQDPDGVASVRFRYRADPDATLLAVPMTDDGNGGDEVAGDGLYTGRLNGQSANTLIAFRVEATDATAPGVSSVFPNDAPVRECLVRFGESVPPGSFPSYRFWMTQASFTAWDARNNLNNTLNDVTFVLGNHRVIYNGGAVYAGSPYIAPGFNTPTGNRCGYSVEFPGDDRFLGDAALVLDWPGGHNNENTAIQEQMAYYIADQMNLAFSHRYYIRLTVNGVTDMTRSGVFEAVFQPGSDYLAQWMPGNSDGDFFKIDRAFEFNDTGGLSADPQPQLRIYTTPDVVNGGTKKKIEKYRWYWLKRSFDQAHDYTNLVVLADALNATGPEPYTSQTEALVDVEQWMGIFAVEHIINNFDSWGHTIGKNMYMFKPDGGRWQIYLFDLDWLMLVSPSGPGNYTASTGPLFVGDDPTVTRMYTHPPFRRAYFRAVQNAVNQAFIPAKYEALMDAKYDALVANGITLCDGQPLAGPALVKTWFSQRRTYLVNQLNTVSASFAITSNGGNDFGTDTNFLTLTGTAPVEVQRIQLNGIDYPVIWSSVTNWSIRVAVNPGPNTFALTAVDPTGHVLTNLADQITVTGTGTPAAGRVVINEIFYHAPLPGSEFIELYNASSNAPVDLSGWRVNGLDYTFGKGTILEPRSFLLLAEDRDAFGAAYGGAIRVNGVFNGHLDQGGETLSLIQPGVTPAQDRLVNIVTYDDDPPWSSRADGAGASLQLIDAQQDTRRVANWSDGTGWRPYTSTGTPGVNATNLVLFLASAGDLFMDDFVLVESVPGSPGTNYLANGDFESGELSPWRAQVTHSNSVVSAEQAHSGRFSLHLIAFGPGTSISFVAQALPLLTPTNLYTFSFWYMPSPRGSGLSFRVTIPFRNTTPIDFRPTPSTPGTTNALVLALPPFPDLWINEILPVNQTGLADNFGEREPWVELYNAGPNNVSLDGWFLTDNYTNLARWPFPSGANIGSGEFLLVWLDGEPAESTAATLHAGFRAAPTNGALGLVFPANGLPTLLDYVNYGLPTPDRSLGFYPDGQTGARETFFFPTPGASNDNRIPPLRLYINEWMAANTSFITDPVDGDYDDWFELYNPGDTAIALDGFSLSDRLDDPSARWFIPAGRSIPAHGYLLVWADEETGQNALTSLELHAGFRLSQNGEAIGVFAPDGTVVDSITFLAQTNNVSQGRWPDGASSIFYMPTPTPRAANIVGNGTPPVQLLPALRMPSGDVILNWSAEAGKTYAVEFSDNLSAPGWTELGRVTAGSAAASTTNRFSGSPQRFYRVRRLAQ